MKEQRKGNGMKDTNIQWHPAFVSAMQLEFKEDRGKLLFEKEHNLNTRPLQIDLLVIRKEENGKMENEIGKIFRKFNVFEYKSPGQSLDIDSFYKSAAYACLYKSYGKTVNERKAEDITVSIIRGGRPEKLFQHFEEYGLRIENPCHGIYYILDNVLFPTQIIVAKELDGGHHTWIKSLTDKMKEKDIRRLIRDAGHLTEKQDKEFADSVLEVCFRANEQIIEKLKGDDTMSEALLEIMEPLIEPIIEERIEPMIAERIEPMIAERIEPMIAERERMIEIQIRKETKEEMEKAKEKGIRDTILLLRKLGHNNDVIKTAIMEQYLLSDEEITRYL